jgi:hypothetical protein
MAILRILLEARAPGAGAAPPLDTPFAQAAQEQLRHFFARGRLTAAARAG